MTPDQIPDTDHYTNSLLDTLTAQTTTALQTVRHATRALNTLTGFQVYAAGLADTDLGSDAAAELAIAARALRNVRRIAEEHTARNDTAGTRQDEQLPPTMTGPADRDGDGR